MRITLAGTSSGMAVANRAPSALFVEINQDAFLIDAGDGTARQLVRLGLDYKRIRAIIITHTHADHAAGLIGMLQLMHLSGREEPVQIFVPDVVRDRMNDLLPLYHIFSEKWPFKIDFFEIKNMTEKTVSTLTFKPILNSHLAKNEKFALKHQVGTESFSLIFREAGHQDCLYTSDINDFSHLENATENVQILISECTHIDVEQGIRFAECKGISRVLFTHIPPDVDENINAIKRRFTDPSIRFASDGETIEIV
ncbi:MBL fold metallo-hydrolase [candidate division KSB1 bacterium]|nr:MBL fold metallo-hydrolase [candidate division KSB1 bacterium]